MIAHWHKNGTDQPPVEVWDVENNKKGEYYEEYRMFRLREQRDILLTDSDWTCFNDSPLSDEEKSKWTTYRQSLRNLPATASPELDENNDIIDITWPTKPE